MSQQYYTLVTNIGAARIAKATALGTVVNLSQMAVGDGGGQPITPSATATELTREVYRAGLNLLEVDETNQNHVIAELLIPEEEGDFTIREVGLFDNNNNLIAIGSIADSYKPRLSSGTASQQIIRMVIQIDNTDAVGLKVDPAVVLASRDFVTKEVSRITANSVARVDSIDSLRAYNGASQTVIVEAYYKNGSLGGGLFSLDINDTQAADNGGTVIVGAQGARWKRIDKELTAFDFGAKGSPERINTTYDTLAAAQKKYPAAQSLDDTFDLVAINQGLKVGNIKLPAAQYHINRSIAVPSNRVLSGVGVESQINCTADMPRYAHMIVNSEGDYIVGGKPDSEVLAAIEKNAGNENITIKKLYLRGDLDTKKQMTRSGVCLKHVKNSLISAVKTSWTGYHGIDISDASEGHLTDMQGKSGQWEEKPSENVRVEGCFVEYHGDDGYTTHFSNDIIFDRCVARYGAQIFNASNGFEIDDTSRNCTISNSIAIREQVGFVVKRHDAAIPSSSHRVIGNVAQFCGISFWFYGAQNIKAKQYSEAFGIQAKSNASLFCRRHEKTNGRTQRDLLIQDITGANISDFLIIGANYSGKVKCADTSDYQPFYTDENKNLQRVTKSMMPYAESVTYNGADVTNETTVNILIDKNSRGVTIDGVQILGAAATQAHIYIGAKEDGVRGIAVKNVTAIDCSGADVIGLPTDVPDDCSIINIYAESSKAVAGKNILKVSSSANVMARLEVDNIRGRDYEMSMKFGNGNFAGNSFKSELTAKMAADPNRAPLNAITNSAAAAWLTFKNYDNLLFKFDSVENAVRESVLAGKALWFGHTDERGSVTPRWGMHANGNLIPYTSAALNLGSVTNKWEQVHANKWVFASNIYNSTGKGSPEGVVGAGVGSLYHRLDGTAGAVLYVKESGTGNTGWRAIGQNVIVQTGMISDGGTIPLPEGYTQEQCRWIVSMRADNPNNESWDINEDGSYNHFYYEIYADENRLVTAKMHRNSYPQRSINVNYMIIGIK